MLLDFTTCLLHSNILCIFFFSFTCLLFLKWHCFLPQWTWCFHYAYFKSIIIIIIVVVVFAVVLFTSLVLWHYFISHLCEMPETVEHLLSSPFVSTSLSGNWISIPITNTLYIISYKFLLLLFTFFPPPLTHSNALCIFENLHTFVQFFLSKNPTNITLKIWVTKFW